MAGIIDILDANSSTGRTVRSAASSTGSALAQQVIASSEFQQVLDKVEASAKKGVVDEASKNAVNLFVLAVAGGAVGGFFFRGLTGTAIAAALAVYAGSQIAGGGGSKPKQSMQQAKK